LGKSIDNLVKTVLDLIKTVLLTMFSWYTWFLMLPINLYLMSIFWGLSLAEKLPFVGHRIKSTVNWAVETKPLKWLQKYKKD
jgi:hypothetical protein